MPSTAIQPLQGIRILSLALNLPGPAALWRCAGMGADCRKLEPLAPGAGRSADPMGLYCPDAYAQMHDKVQTLQADLKTAEGQASLHEQLAQTDVLLTSFRPSALSKLGLGWEALQQRYDEAHQAWQRQIKGEVETVALDQLVGRVSANMILPYPPGVPLLMPGEMITAKSRAVLDFLLMLCSVGHHYPGFETDIHGAKLGEDGLYRVRVLKMA